MEHPGRIRLDPDKVRAARRRRALSRGALARSEVPGLAISEATVKRAEQGRALSLGKARTLARLLGVDLESLLPDADAAVAAAEAGRAPTPFSELPLVGRDAELERIDVLLDRCLAGQPGLLVLEGEAGVGKTRLLSEACRRLHQRGGVACVGHGHERGGPSFQPWVDALEPGAERLGLAADEPGERTWRFLDPGGPATHRGDDRDPAPFRALAHRLVAVPEPTLVVLDDLQWMDGGSVALLEHVVLACSQAAELGRRSRLLCAASFRRDDLPQRAAAVLDRLAREPLAETLCLEPVDAADTFELIRSLGVERPARQLVSAVHEGTGGNPLFVRAVVELLRARGAIRVVGGDATTGVDPRDLELPHTLTAAVEARLESLSPPSRRVLGRAAFLGGWFELPKLAAVLGEDEDTVLPCLEEAVRQGFLANEAGQRFEFVHPLVRHVLYHEPISARRQRIHYEIAERLHAWLGGAADASAREIADHLLHAGPMADAGSVIRFARRAARESMDACAWQDAARYAEAALTEGRRRDALPDADVAELHHQAGVAHHLCWSVGPGLLHYEAAARAFERAGDVVGLAGALNDRVRLADNAGSVPYGETADAEPLERALEALGDRDPVLRGRILDTLAMVHATGRDPERAEALATGALEIGRREEDEDLCAQVSTSLAFAHLQRLRLHAARDRWQEGVRHAARAGSGLREGRCLQRLAMMHLALGDLDDAMAVGEEAWARTQSILSGESAMPRAAQAAVLLLRGEAREAERLATQAAGILRRHRYAWPGTAVFPLLAQVRLLRGDATGAHEALDTLVTPGVVYEDPKPLERSAQRHRWLVDASRGSPHLSAEVGARLAASPPRAPRLERLDVAAVNRLCVEVELAWAVGAPALSAHAASGLRIAVERGMRVTTAWVQCVPRLAGLAEAGAGRFEAANRHLLEASAWAERENAPIERARTRLDHATVLRDEGSAASLARARELVHAALRAFESLGLSRLAERAEHLAADVGA